jgi:hypothetical protein
MKRRVARLITTVRLSSDQARGLAKAIRETAAKAPTVKLFVYTAGIAVEPGRTRKPMAPRLHLVK